MHALNSSEIQDIVDRHPAVFGGQILKRFAPILGMLVVILYGVYAWSFFNINEVMARANWDIAGNYLADWVAYEVRPDIQMYGTYLEVEFPRYSPLGKNPVVGWINSDSAIVTKSTGETTETASQAAQKTASSGFMTSSSPVKAPAVSSFMAPGVSTGSGDTAHDVAAAAATVTEEAIVHAVVTIGDATVDIEPGLVTVARADETIQLSIDLNETVTPLGPLPVWARQKQIGGKVVVRLGFAGRVEIEDDEVKVRRRFLGWENFLFDTNSPFWGKPLSEVASMIISGPDVEPDTSNIAAAWHDIRFNSEWQHQDVWIKLLQTIVMAFVGTLFASLVAFPLAFAAARNINGNRAVNQILKRSFDFLRSVDMLIWALVFTRTFGPGPLAGISAIFFTDTGTFGKLYSETLENIDDKQREGIKSVGANPLLVQRYGVVPQVLPVFLSQSLYFWESNTRSATIIGAVGAGGIGLKLWEAMRTNQDWENVGYMVVLILIVVFVFDNISNFLRGKLIGRS